MEGRLGRFVEKFVDYHVTKKDVKVFLAGAAILSLLIEIYGIPSGNTLNLPALIITAATGVSSIRI